MTYSVRTGAATVDPSGREDDGGSAAAWTSRSDALFRIATAVAIPLASLRFFVGLYVPVSDPDTFWHLRLGDHLSRSWNFVGVEPWSSLAQRQLVFHEWVPELFLIAGYRVGGYSAVAWLAAAGGVLLLLTLYVCCRRFAAPLVAALVAMIGFGGALPSVSPRPQTVSFILLTVFTMAWLSTSLDGRARWWLVPLSWIWACSHGMWFLGPVVGLVVITGMLLDRRVDMLGALRLGLIPLSGVLLAALTPVGPRLLYTAVGMRAYTDSIVEWNPPSIFMAQSLFTLGLALVLVVVWVRSPTRTPWTELGLWATGVACALMYARTIAVGAIVLALLSAVVLGRHLAVSPARTPSRRLETLTVLLGVAAVLLLGPLVVRSDVSKPEGVPVDLEPALSRLPEGTVVFNDYDLGGWLLWAHPELDPVIDGRADVYDVEYFNRTLGAHTLASGWESTVQASGARVALLKSNSPLEEALRTRLNWAVIGANEPFVLLEAPG